MLEHDAFVLRKNLLLRVKLHEILRQLGDTTGKDCLEVGSSNGAFCLQLRRRGGQWETASADAATAQGLKTQLEGDVAVVEAGQLPFAESQFDVVVLMDFLEREADDNAVIAECHRVLKPDGFLVLGVTHAKPWSLLYPIQSVLGVTFERRGWRRRGYTEGQLFAILKDGFNVHGTRKYSRFLIQLVDAMTRNALGRPSEPGRRERGGWKHIYGLAGPAYWLAFQLDLLLFFTRGHCLIVKAQRRAWIPRKTPVLTDGRTISEAVLSRIGA